MDDPRIDLETAVDPGLGVPTDDVDDAIRLELEFLTSLIWAPDTMTAAAVGAIGGTAASRSEPDDRLPQSAELFLRPIHATVFGAVVARVQGGLPVTPILLSEGIEDPRVRAGLRDVLLEIAAPSAPGFGPLPGGADVPHLAAALVDRWYRRGYVRLLSQMTLAVQESATAGLADHWASLTAHQQTALRRWSTVRARLADL